MAKLSKISWTDGTLNFWEGCTKVSEGCLHCYAEDRDRRWHGGQHWGKGAPRKKSVSAVKDLRRYNQHAEDGRFIRCQGCGARRWRSDQCCDHKGPVDIVRPTFFVMSLGDFADEEVADEWRAEALNEMLDATGIDFMVLTKRPEALYDLFAKASLKMTPAQRERILDWIEGNEVPANIAIGATVESCKTASRRLDALCRFPAARRFVSAEPLLSGGWAHLLEAYTGLIHLVIAGGESGNQARPMNLHWALELEMQCDANLIPFHFKQWGEWVPMDIVEQAAGQPHVGNVMTIDLYGSPTQDPHQIGACHVWRAGKKNSGWALDKFGRTRTERLGFPTQAWKENWYSVMIKDGPHAGATRYFPCLTAAQEWIHATPMRWAKYDGEVKKFDGWPKI